jgi:hypothetical protein
MQNDNSEIFTPTKDVKGMSDENRKRVKEADLFSNNDFIVMHNIDYQPN